MSDGQIVVSGLTKVYKQVRAVDNLSFAVEPGRVTGFLGPNGAGKTTTLRNQIGATVAAIVLYMGGFITAAIGIFPLFANLFNQEWISGLQWGVPSLASQLMVSGTNLPGQPAWWVGGVVLVGWALLAGAAGVLIMRKRDIG